MSQYTDLKNTIDANVNTNGVQSITGAVMNDVLNEIVDFAEGKQDALVSGTNIKTINGESILGSGDIEVQGGGGIAEEMEVYIGDTEPTEDGAKLWINPAEEGGGGGGEAVEVVDNLESDSTTAALSANQGRVLNEGKQDALVSGTNIKTINNQSILGSGNITIEGGGGGGTGGTSDIKVREVEMDITGTGLTQEQLAYNAETFRLLRSEENVFVLFMKMNLNLIMALPQYATLQTLYVLDSGGEAELSIVTVTINSDGTVSYGIKTFNLTSN